MSHEASSWALRQSGAGRGPKLLLLVLANHADKRGVCFPGQAGLAVECECGVRTVRRDVEELERRDLLGRARRVNPRGVRKSDWIVLAPGGERGDMLMPEEADYPADVVALARGVRLPANLAASPTGQSGLRSPVSGESSEAQASSSENPPTPPSGAAGGSPPPQPSPLRARARTRGGPDQDRAAFDRLAEPLRPFVVPVRQVLLRIAEAKAGTYEPTVAAICGALDAHPRKDFLPEASKYEHWALHGPGRDQRVKDVVRQFRNWLERSPDVLRRTKPAPAGFTDDPTSRLREHLRPRLVEAGHTDAAVDAMTDVQLRVAEAEL